MIAADIEGITGVVHWDQVNPNYSEYSRFRKLMTGDVNVEGVMYVGYLGRMGTINAILDHTWSDERVSGLWINNRAFGESGLNGAACGHFDVPIIMASGDQMLCVDVQDFFGKNVEIVQIKKSTSRMSAECMPSSAMSKLIENAAERAIQNIKN